MGSIKGKVFIDTNMIKYAHVVEKVDMFDWLQKVYESIYIHKEVLDELYGTEAYTVASHLVADGTWELFNPDDANCLDMVQKLLYDEQLKLVEDAFRELSRRKKADGKTVKTTNNTGEIHSLAAALILNAEIISSNDYEIREIIEYEKFTIISDVSNNRMLIQQDTLEDFCVLCVKHGIADNRKQVKTLLSVALRGDPKLKEKKEKLDERLRDLGTYI
ncbi:hypothetical protein [Bacillus sp. JJ722]|uniref:hypothetical protein n=1 Tax=Bacillus sp. JJ722 TaxID=3122973 RepID=UPI002FFEAAAC